MTFASVVAQITPVTALTAVGVAGGLYMIGQKVFGSSPVVDKEANKLKTVLITGCDTGFGAGLAQAALDAGYQVVAACYTAEGAARFKGTATTVIADLRKDAGRAQVVAAALKVAGDRGLYALVNNAGLCRPGNVAWLDPQAYEDCMTLNFHTPVALTYALVPALKKAQGRVINVSSVGGFIPLPQSAAYSCSKHALEAFSDIMRCELRPWKVNVTVIQPASMRTPMAMSFPDQWLASFRAAPAARQAYYGDDWATAVHKGIHEGMESVAADPAETVQGLMRALTATHPPTRIMTGWVARWIFKPISRLGDTARDVVLHALTGGANIPAGLVGVEQVVVAT
jgi:NAD(P)-dependent dehydrogenase (short-subunit alcohol dehydrogenase family)